MPERYSNIRKLTDKQLVERVTGDYKQASADKAIDIARCNRYLKIYQALDQAENIIDETSGKLSDDRRIYSNTYLPVGAAVVDTAASALYNSFFSSPDYFEIEGAQPADDLFAPRITAHIMKRHREMQFRSTVYRTLQQALIFDYAITMVKWKLEGGHIPQRVVTETVIPFGKIKAKRRDVEVQMQWIPDAVDRSDLTLFDYFNCYHDKKAKRGFEDAEFFIDIRNEIIEDLMEKSEHGDALYGRYKNIPEIITKLTDELAKHTPVTSEEEEPLELLIRRRVKVTRYWTRHHVVELIGDTVISRQDIDGWPLQLWRIHTLPNQFKGMGIIQRMERPQYDINAIVNLKRDHQNLTLNPIAVIDEELVDINDGKVELYPGKVLISSGGNPKDKAYFYQPGAIAQGASEEIALQMEVIKDVVGLGPNQLGNFSQGRKTARETSAVAAGAMSKIMTVALNLEETCLEPIYLGQFKLEQRWMRAPDTFKYHGRHAVEWVQITPADYKWMAQPRFLAKGTSIIKNREVEIQQFMMAADRAMLAPQYHNLPEIFTQMWKMLVPLEFQRFVKDPNQRQLNIPAEIENRILAEGGDIQVSPANDDAEHIQGHEAYKLTPDFIVWPESLKARMDHHIQGHQAAQQQANMSQQNAQATFQDSSDQDRGLRGASLPTGGVESLT
jgi:hypothetical protein